MPELPEVETVCRLLRRAAVGHKIEEVEVVPDSIVFGDAPPAAIISALRYRTVTRIGRKGKFWWMEFGEPPVVCGHFGMAGWMREVGEFTIRLKEFGDAPLDDEQGRPRFLKLMFTTDEGRKLAFTDGRRLGRIWLANSASEDQRLAKLGPDALDSMPSADGLRALYGKRKAPIKALLMDQAILSGLGNWLADEVLYQARIAPQRPATSLSVEEFKTLRSTTLKVLKKAVEVGADDRFYPKTWLFHYRWGGSRGHETIGGKPIERDEVGGRTTAWVPALQR